MRRVRCRSEGIGGAENAAQRPYDREAPAASRGFFVLWRALPLQAGVPKRAGVLAGQPFDIAQAMGAEVWSNIADAGQSLSAK